ncbi:hypothetical protein B0H11DRAFT_1927743 [Mycena galericulata]|nr:hypothetical protein B0H11DRAFT_1927743 [Mycena galericulata]
MPLDPSPVYSPRFPYITVSGRDEHCHFYLGNSPGDPMTFSVVPTTPTERAAWPTRVTYAGVLKASNDLLGGRQPYAWDFANENLRDVSLHLSKRDVVSYITSYVKKPHIPQQAARGDALVLSMGSWIYHKILCNGGYDRELITVFWLADP